MCLASGAALALHVDALIAGEVDSVATACSWHLVVRLFALSGWTCSHIFSVVGEKLVLRSSVEDLVVLVLPLFAGVLAAHASMLAGEVTCTDRDQIHVPHSYQEVFELEILLKGLVEELMVFHELGASNGFIAAELVVSVVEGGEHFEEAEACLLGRLDSGDDVWVPRGVEAVLHLFELEGAIAVSVELVEGLAHKSLAKGIQLAAEGSQKFIETNLAISAGIKDSEETFSVASAHAWHAIVVEHSLELAETQLARAIGIHDSKLLLEANETLGASGCDPVFELVDDEPMLGAS